VASPRGSIRFLASTNVHVWIMEVYETRQPPKPHKISGKCAPGVWFTVHRNRGRREGSKHAHTPNYLPLFSLAPLAGGGEEVGQTALSPSALKRKVSPFRPGR